MPNAVLQSAGYVLVHAPDMVLHNGTTQTTERIVNPESEYLQKISGHLRSYEQALAYAPNQVYIGNMTAEDLKQIPFPWYDKHASGSASGRFGKFGEIMPEDEFIGLMQAVDAFDLVKLTEAFSDRVKEKCLNHPLLTKHAAAIKPGLPLSDIQAFIDNTHAEALVFEGQTVGCVKRAHDIDVNLSAHVMFENLASKASATLALMHMANKNGIDIKTIDYIIECSEEACGDMNQRGGGNFAKGIAEAAGAVNATGSDTRGFCAAPVHALIEAASLVKAGTFKCVAIVAGGATAKLGMNGKDHVKKGLPILEDVLGGFAALVSVDDGIHPVINTECVGRHTVATGSAPQAVISSLVSVPLSNAGLKITDIDKFAAELQNPDITKPAGAGDVPEANYKMIAALSVMRKEIERNAIPAFIEKHGMPGFAPTQGHIPSGVPFLGFAMEGLTLGTLNKVMIIGKGSLFLGRMTNLFDGISVLLERNKSKTPSKTAANNPDRKHYRIGITVNGSEHGVKTLVDGALAARAEAEELTVVLIGERNADHNITAYEAGLERLEWAEVPAKDAHKVMERMLDNGELDGCVTMHYPFPIGVTTIGKSATPGTGKEMFIAATTGMSAAERVEAMVKNTLYGIAAAKALGNPKPSVGILNIDAAVKTERALKQLRDNGYAICFSESIREDGGLLMRGNDLLQGTADVMATDTLTGNIIMKMLSSFTTGGGYESVGSGYGPGLGEHYKRLVMILSRASGSPVAKNALLYALKLLKGDIYKKLEDELKAARAAGLDEIIAGFRKQAAVNGSTDSETTLPKTLTKETLGSKGQVTEASVLESPVPEKEVVTVEIAGIDIMELEDAVKALHKAGIYAESGMGCTGPVALVNDLRAEQARKVLEGMGLLT